jgi:uncharacterized tellurite resistance protein B-like protein
MERHPLTAYPHVERVDYLSVLAAIAAADATVTDEELSHLRHFCESVEIDDIGIGLIIAALEHPAVVNLPAILPRLAQTDLKFTLLADMLCIAQADGIVCPAEQAEINTIAAMLGITAEQITAVNRYVDTVLAAQTTQRAEADWRHAGSELAGILASAGVPLSAVAIAGTVFGNGLSSGLAALGMGLGVPPGVGAAISLGVGRYFGVRWLFKKLFEGA